MFTVCVDKNPVVYATCGFILLSYLSRHAVNGDRMLGEVQKTMMRNFQLLEGEHDHSGSPKQGPLAAFDETFKGNDYFHIRRVYRGIGGSWSPTGNGISCRLDQAPAMLDALAAYLMKQGYHITAKRNGKAKPDTALDDAMMRAAAQAAESIIG